MQTQIQPLLAFAAGVLSFLSPCIIPMIPSYVSFVSGASLQDLGRPGAPRLRVVGRTAFFALGFSLIFIALGLFVSGIGNALGPGSRIISSVSGILIIAFGLNVIFDFWKLLNREKRLHLSTSPRGFGGAILLGMAFGAGWTPCVGPILASILLVAGSTSGVGRGSVLLIAYSLGLGLPFLLMSAFFDPLLRQLARVKRHLPAIRITTGVFLVILGSLIVLGRLERMNSWLFRLAGALQSWNAENPLSARAVFAGIFTLGAIPMLLTAIKTLKRGKTFPAARTVFVSLLSIFAVLTITGIVDVPAIFVAWFSFRGL